MGLFNKKKKTNIEEDFDARMKTGFEAEQAKKANQLAYLKKLTNSNGSVNKVKDKETVLTPDDNVR